MIVDGVLLPGERLGERELCERFGISRTPLREALKVLAGEGLVELLPHRGARVTRLSAEERRHRVELTGALEALAGELACARIDDAAIAEIAALTATMAGHHADDDRSSYFACNQRIHQAIVHAAGNPQLTEMYGVLSRRMRRARYLANVPRSRWDEAMHEHEAILAALRARDGAGLGRLLREHLSHKYDVVHDVFAEPEAPERGADVIPQSSLGGGE
ncbi:MAG: GntR family transcriptional regulator [Vulcanimicrobiaceae bacterium]